MRVGSVRRALHESSTIEKVILIYYLGDAWRVDSESDLSYIMDCSVTTTECVDVKMAPYSMIWTTKVVIPAGKTALSIKITLLD